MIKIIAAAGLDNSIGLDNKLLWHLPDDLKRFKSMTLEKNIVMGRKTFESFPKPLKNRNNIVLTSDNSYIGECEVFTSIKDLLYKYKDQELLIIGGGEIYKQFIDICDVIELTVVNENFYADTYFPEIPESFEVILNEFHTKDEKHLFDFNYLTYKRK